VSVAFLRCARCGDARLPDADGSMTVTPNGRSGAARCSSAPLVRRGSARGCGGRGHGTNVAFSDVPQRRIVMRRATLVLVGAVLLALPVGSIWAASSDCEAARCAIQDALNQQCPCDAATNHGKYVSCVARLRNNLAKAGTIPINCKGAVQRCAARSTCGKPGFVTCQIPTDTCTSGTCAANPTVTCVTDFDCGTRCKTKSSVDRCTAAGGAVGTSSTCCADCAPPSP